MGGSFTEYYAMDYQATTSCSWATTGPGTSRIAEGKTKVRPLQVYHGKVGRGLSVEMSVKHGPVTLLSVVQTVDGRLKLLVAEGESVPGPDPGDRQHEQPLSLLPSAPGGSSNEWNGHGPAHHCAVGVGHVASKIDKLGSLLDMDVARVC